jgi:hypothetical protein
MEVLIIVAITTKVGFVFHAHKASELPLFVVPCLADVNTKGNCLVGGSLAIGKYIAYRADLQAQSVDLSPFIRYDISRIKMKANDVHSVNTLRSELAGSCHV